MPSKREFLGFGLGLRADHFHYVSENLPNIDWFEINTENFLVPGGKPRHYLMAIAEHYPLVMHGVSMSIGGTDPIDWAYLRQIKALAELVKPAWVSDHLCWTSVNGINSHDLLPLPYTEEAVDHVASRIIQVQDFLERTILIENLSSYLGYTVSEMQEWDFLSAIAAVADCDILLDINNIYVSARNHGFDPQRYVDSIDPARVRQFHLAGHNDSGKYIVDTHDQPIVEPVWDLYRYALEHTGPVSTMIERDSNIPPFLELEKELQIAKQIFAEQFPANSTGRYADAS